MQVLAAFTPILIHFNLLFYRRQFDNIKRVYKAVEEIPGSIVDNIKQSFYLSDELAKQYASIVFLAAIRFETSKKVSSSKVMSLKYLVF